MFVDHDGSPIDATSAERHAAGDARRARRATDRDDDPRPLLLDNRDLARAVSAAAGMAIENGSRARRLRAARRGRARSSTRSRTSCSGSRATAPTSTSRPRARATSTTPRSSAAPCASASHRARRADHARGERALATGEVQTIEYELDFGVEVRTTRDASSPPVTRVHLIVRDFTQRGSREIALERASRARGAARRDPGHHVRSGATASTAATRRTTPTSSCPPEQFMGRAVRDVLPADVAEAIMSCGERALEGGTPQPIEYDLVLGGQHRFFEAGSPASTRTSSSSSSATSPLAAPGRRAARTPPPARAAPRRARAGARHDRPRRERRAEHPRTARRGRRHPAGEPARRRADFGYVRHGTASGLGRPFWEIFAAGEHRAERARPSARCARHGDHGAEPGRWETATGEGLVVADHPLPEDDGIGRHPPRRAGRPQRARQREEAPPRAPGLVQAADDGRGGSSRTSTTARSSACLLSALRLAQARAGR